MPPAPPSSHFNNAREAPADPPGWREGILRALASEGVTEPAYVPVWRLVLINTTVIVAWVFLPFLPLFAVLLAAAYVPFSVFAFFLFASLLAIPVIFIKFISKRIPMLGRRSRVDWRGRNATHAVKNARRAPIFYLRSFMFDEEAGELPFKHWVGYTPEMTLILRLRRYSPVLAIAKPHENQTGLGALRFAVTDEHWEEVVKAIIPCCRLVVWVTGNTPGLNWEIEHLVASLPPDRLLLWPSMNIMTASWKTAHSWEKDWAETAYQRNTAWLQFVDAHKEVFPKPLPRDISDIRFIAFDRDWSPIPVPGPRYPYQTGENLQDPKGLIMGLRAFLNEKFR
jgi:hypothetical protein